MSDMIYYKNGEETFHISPPTDEIKCPKTKLEIKMTEKERIQGEIKILEKKLWFLEEIEEHKDQEMRKAFKDDYGYSPYRNELSWVGFQKGWEASQKDYKVGEPYCPDDPIWYDEVEWDEKDNPPEPTSTAFRQKLFDGIKSVFYDPDYERTHWKMKVNMAVDEVLTHFYDIIPEPQEPICDEFDKGWNCCLAEIKAFMEHTDD